MNHQRVDLSTLLASNQPRPLITADVDKLASSIKEVGLIQPITVKPHAVSVGGLTEPGFQIVAGHHRVAACRALGWTEVDAIVIEDGGHLQAELIEIDENLCRSELSTSQRSKAVKRRKEIWEALHPSVITYSELRAGSVVITGVEVNGVLTEQVGEVCPPVAKHGHAQDKGFAASTAAVTGEAKRTINQHLARAEALGDDLDKVTGTSLDKGVEMDALAALPPEQRAPLIERAQAGEKVSARAQKPVKPAHTTASLIAALQDGASALQAAAKKIDRFRSMKGSEVATLKKKLTLALESLDKLGGLE